MLILGADVWGHGLADVRLHGGTIAAIGQLSPREGEPVLMANGGALLPGLHDHHIHLPALAARRLSVSCGPPRVNSRAELAVALACAPGTGWIRGIDYHESVLGGLPDARTLDALVSDRPLRMQHRSGRMWLLNRAALERLLDRAAPPAGLEREHGRFTGRLFDEDRWLQDTLGSRPPDLGEASAALARCGVTGLTDMSPRNAAEIAAHFEAQIAAGILVQRCVLAGALELAAAQGTAWHLGPAKLHLHEAALPPVDEAISFVRAAHRQGRPVAVHCVSEVELVFTLAVLAEAGTIPGDRIEHASVARLELVEEMARLQLHACVQPHFIFERGDRYLVDVELQHQPDLYRLRALADRGIPVAGGSDAPYGDPDPWLAMNAAVHRRTRAGQVIGAEEALTPEEALALFLADPMDLSTQRAIVAGAPADLCLLDRPWNEARARLSSADVRTTIVAGRIVHQRVDEAPT